MTLRGCRDVSAARERGAALRASPQADTDTLNSFSRTFRALVRMLSKFFEFPDLGTNNCAISRAETTSYSDFLGMSHEKHRSIEALEFLVDLKSDLFVRGVSPMKTVRTFETSKEKELNFDITCSRCRARSP